MNSFARNAGMISRSYAVCPLPWICTALNADSRPGSVFPVLPLKVEPVFRVHPREVMEAVALAAAAIVPAVGIDFGIKCKRR